MRAASRPSSESSDSLSSSSSGSLSGCGLCGFLLGGSATRVVPSTSCTSPVGSLIGRRPTSTLSASSSCWAQRARPAVSYSASSDGARRLRFGAASSSSSELDSDRPSYPSFSSSWPDTSESPSESKPEPSSEPSEPKSTSDRSASLGSISESKS